MNQIQEKDWAEDDWHSHTGIDSSCDYCITAGKTGEEPSDSPEDTGSEANAGEQK